MLAASARRAVGAGTMHDARQAAGPGQGNRTLLSDARFSDPAKLMANSAQLAAILDMAFGSRPLAHWPMSSSKPTSPSAPCAPLATKRTLLLTSAGLVTAGSQAGLAPTGSHQLAAGR